MIKHLVYSFLILISLEIQAQNPYLSGKLSEAIAENQSPLEVIIVMKSKVNLDSLQVEFRKHTTDVNLRAKTTIALLMQKSKLSQANVLNHLYSLPQGAVVSELRSYWICNAIVAKIIPSEIQNLNQFSEIDHLELASENTVLPIVPKKGAGSPKSAGGHEPGLSAIHAPALWAMGYTGHGTLMYSVDTGCWPQHPAIGSRFMGNFAPLSQAWLPFDLENPGDKSNSHGTHILGTTLGLEQATQDTIGVAFNAYWIATDPIVQDLAFVKPIPVIMSSFEWALNPDGDTATTTDIPDAINNSWGIALRPQDDTLCVSIVSDILNAVEAAGIAAIFSAGNEGPGVQTVGRPAFISLTEVNNFAIGAVNAADTNFNIASFSSRGPSVCNGSGSLLIKPEVSAPGVNVRSSVGQNGYANYDGTSMASPHVTGAILLLKEAFPYLSGEELKRALYYSATDLGDLGEDNVYGMGMINVEAAFYYLSQTHTPVPPASQHFDLAVETVTYPADGSLLCEPSFTPEIVLNNYGDSTAYAATIHYKINGFSEQTFNWTGNLTSGQSQTITLPNYTFSGLGKAEFIAKAELLDTNIVEFDYVNNQRVSRINFISSEAIPFFEGFEQGIDASKWLIINPNNDKTWDTIATSGLPYSQHSAFMAFGATISSNRVDEMISPKLSLANADSVSLKFSVAYKFRSVSISDTLKVLLSTDCGASFPNLVYKKGGQELSTQTGNTINFLPSEADHWREETVNLSQYAGQDGVVLKFLAKNRRGNYLSLDNIWLYNGIQPQAIAEIEPNDITLFPNPAQNYVQVSIKNQKLSTTILSVYSLTGELILKTKSDRINTENLTNGIYFIEISTGNQTLNKKLVIEH